MKKVLLIVVLLLTYNVAYAKVDDAYAHGKVIYLIKKIYQSFLGNNHYEVHIKFKNSQHIERIKKENFSI
jgi:hypothetical protein